MSEPTLTSAYWHDKFIDIKNPHKKDEFLRVPLNRTWVGLTDEELEQLSNKWRIIYGGHVGDFAHEIEAKLKDKNA